MTEALNFYCVVIGPGVIMMSGWNTSLRNNDELPCNCDYLRQDTNVPHECCIITHIITISIIITALIHNYFCGH